MTQAVRVFGVDKMYRLLCKDAHGSTFEVAPSAEPVTGFKERCCYVLELDHETPCILVVDDVAVENTIDSGVNRWTWEPQFFAGTVLAELFDHNGVRLAEYRFDVAPSPDKLGHVFFARILDELLAADPKLLFGAEAAQINIGAEGTFGNPHLEYSRLKVFGPLLVQAIRQLCVNPLTRLRADRQLVPAHRVRRFDQHSVKSLARTPQMLAVLNNSTGGTTAPERLLFDMPVSREELDTPAHRTLLALLLTVVGRVRKVRADLERGSEMDRANSFRTPAAPRMTYRGKLLDDLEQSLRRQCRAVPFSAVRRAEVSAAGLNVIAGHPLYAAAYRRGWQILRSGVEGPHEGEMLPVSPTWEIYERWCFFHLTDTLRHMFPTLSWKRRSVSDAVDRVVDIGIADGITVTAYLQKTFPAMDKKNATARFHSISGERRPDIVVTFLGAGRQRFIVFDPKYSVTRTSVLGAMEAAHTYRDSLRWSGRAPDLVLLLLPAEGEVSWLEDSDFHTEHGVGALPLSPGIGQGRMRSILEQYLLDA